MPIPDTNGLPPFAEFQDIKNKINELVAKYNNLLVNLDSLNVVRLDAGTVQVYDLNGGTGTITLDGSGMTVNNGTFNTFTVDINGNVTMTSATIQSATGYPKVIMDPNGDLLGAYQDANNHVDIEPTGPASTPSLNFYNADSPTLPRGANYLTDISGNTYYTMFGAERIQITGTQIWLNGPVLINSYASITDGGLTLQDQLDLLQNQITALKNRYDVHVHAYSGTDSGGDTYGGNTGGPNN